MPAEEDEVVRFEIPDPREWIQGAEFRDLVHDIQAIDDVLSLLSGKIVGTASTGPAYNAVRGALSETGAQLREQLAVVILRMYGLDAGEDGVPSPFSGAGRARAFGAESPPPAGTLCPD